DLRTGCDELRKARTGRGAGERAGDAGGVAARTALTVEVVELRVRPHGPALGAVAAHCDRLGPATVGLWPRGSGGHELRGRKLRHGLGAEWRHDARLRRERRPGRVVA